MTTDATRTFCPYSPNDDSHCEHWQDGDACCWCKAPPMTAAEKQEQGMEL